MSTAIMLKTQNYCLSIRQELGYPAYAPVCHTLAFASGGPADALKAIEIGRHATAMNRDIVYTAWKTFGRAEPASIAVALREQTHVDVVTDCFLWAVDATAPLMIVAPRRGEHFVLGARGYLERRHGLPARQVARGKRLALERVQRAAARMGTDLLPDNQTIPCGASWVEPAPRSNDHLVRIA